MLHIADRSLRHIYREFFEPVRLRTRSINTKRLYKTTLNNFDEFLGRPATIEDLTDCTVSKFLVWFRNKGRAAHSAEKERSNLLCFWRWLCRQIDQNGKSVVAEWPAVEAEVLPDDPPQAWLQDDLYRLFHAVLNTRGRIGMIPACDWWKALLCVLWDSGERINAIMEATWERCTLSGGWLIIPAADRKGRRKGKTYTLHPETIAALRAIRVNGKRGKIFPWPYAPTYLWKKYTEILERAGLPTDSRSKFHRVRRSVASWAEVAGMNATELLDHSNRKVTKRYLDPRIVKTPSASEVLFRPDLPPPGRDAIDPGLPPRIDRRAE